MWCNKCVCKCFFNKNCEKLYVKSRMWKFWRKWRIWWRVWYVVCEKLSNIWRFFIQKNETNDVAKDVKIVENFDDVSMMFRTCEMTTKNFFAWRFRIWLWSLILLRKLSWQRRHSNVWTKISLICDSWCKIDWNENCCWYCYNIVVCWICCCDVSWTCYFIVWCCNVSWRCNNASLHWANQKQWKIDFLCISYNFERNIETIISSMLKKHLQKFQNHENKKIMNAKKKCWWCFW